MFCPFCRAQLPDDAAFCGCCGKRIPQNRERAHTNGVSAISSAGIDGKKSFQRGIGGAAQAIAPSASLVSRVLLVPVVAMGIYLILDFFADVADRAPEILNTLSLRSAEYAVIGSVLFYTVGVSMLAALCCVVACAMRDVIRGGESGLRARRIVATACFALLMVLIVGLRALAPRIPLLGTVWDGILVFPFEVFGAWAYARVPWLVLVAALPIVSLLVQRGDKARKSSATADESASGANHETS